MFFIQGLTRPRCLQALRDVGAVRCSRLASFVLGTDLLQNPRLLCCNSSVASMETAGDLVVSVPEALLIHSSTAANSDLGRAIHATGADADTLKLLWTCAERRDSESQHAAFWQSLPPAIDTGLTLHPDVLALLEGTSAHASISSAQQHVAEAWAQAEPVAAALLVAFPQHLDADHFDWTSFLWAVQLWYAYSMQVVCPDGQRRECLVPLAGLMNHASPPATAHVVRYGSLNSSSGCLEMRTQRVCMAGDQLFLSYGPLSNLKLLLFYGFVLPGSPETSHFSVDFEVPVDELNRRREDLLQRLDVPLQYTLNTGSSLQKFARCIQILACEENELADMEMSLPQGALIHDVTGVVRQTCDATLGGECEATRIALQRCSERVCKMDCQKGQQQLVEQFLKGQLELLRTLHAGALKITTSSTEVGELI